jgi:type IV pilus assembly protein PilM
MLAEKLNSLLDPFKTKYPSLIGIDISSTALKLVELSETGKGTYRLERYAIEPLVGTWSSTATSRTWTW